MPITDFEQFKQSFMSKLETKTVSCGDVGDILIREPAAVDFEPLDALRRELILRARLDHDNPQDQALIPADDKFKPKEDWPEFSYLKFSPADRKEWFANCADIICACASNGNGSLLFDGQEEFVRSWPGGLLTDVSDQIIRFVRGAEEPENPTTE